MGSLVLGFRVPRSWSHFYTMPFINRKCWKVFSPVKNKTNNQTFSKKEYIFWCFRVASGRPYYDEFLESFPTPPSFIKTPLQLNFQNYIYFCLVSFFFIHIYILLLEICYIHFLLGFQCFNQCLKSISCCYWTSWTHFVIERTFTW